MGRAVAADHSPALQRGRWPAGSSSTSRSLNELMAAALEPLPAFKDPAFGALFDRFADKRVVMLGEASHGTAEFYRARAAISRHLVRRHGFNIVAVEADWPDAAVIDRYVRLREEPAMKPARPARQAADAASQTASADPLSKPFQRFPTWMWRNLEFAEFVAWLREHNASMATQARTSFHGLDIYNMHGSIAAVLEYLDRVDPEAARVARERYACLTPWQKDPAIYGRAALHPAFERCEQAVVQQCRDLLKRQLDYASEQDGHADQADGGDRFLDAAQNARLVASAERYYRVMYHGGADSWNLRDSHMFDTLAHLLEFRGRKAKAIVWAHNSHIGDARVTDMGTERGEHNLGQLARQAWGEQVALVGLGTHTGTVAAAHDWDGEMEVMSVQPSRFDSYERLCHEAGPPRYLLDLRPGHHTALRRLLSEPRLQRYIGVIYRPDTERWSHYAEARLPQQYDAFLWFDETHAITPLGPQHAQAGVPETYPFGV